MLYNPLGAGKVSTIGGAGTTLKKFQSGITNAAGAIVPFYGTVTDYLLPIPGQSKLSGTSFCLRASGSVYVHGASPTVNFSLIGNLGSTPQTDVVLATLTAAQSLTTNVSYDWTMYAEFIGSTAPAVTGAVGGSGNLNVAQVWFNMNNTTSILASHTVAGLTGVKFSGNYGTDYPAGSFSSIESPALFFKFGLTFGVSDALNLASLNEFYSWLEA